jgi:hypothetical protein
MPNATFATPAAPVVAVAEPLATAADIRAAIDVLGDEAWANDTVGGKRAADRAASLRRAVALLRACLHHAGTGR